jgi:hypothetical protein
MLDHRSLNRRLRIEEALAGGNAEADGLALTGSVGIVKSSPQQDL